MSLKTPQVCAKGGVGGVTFFTPTATTGDTFPNTADVIIIVKNASGSSISVTKHMTQTTDGAITDPAVTVADGATEVMGPFESDKYNDTNGLMKVVCSAVSSVTMAIVRVPPL